MKDTLSLVERKILDIIQVDFPLCPDPYTEIANTVGCNREEAYTVVSGLRESGIIRRIGGSFVPAKLGYVSALVCANVEESFLKQVAEKASSYAEVTHNYERTGGYNLWFTVIAVNKNRLESIVNDICNCKGVKAIYPLYPVKTFKIRVNFSFEEGINND